DLVLRDFIPIYLEAETGIAYRLAVLKLMVHVKDTHAILLGNDPVLSRFWGTRHPAIGVSFIDGRWLVSNFLDQDLAEQTGLQLGDELKAINGIDVDKQVSRLSKLIPASNMAFKRRELRQKILLTNLDSIQVTIARGKVKIDD